MSWFSDIFKKQNTKKAVPEECKEFNALSSFMSSLLVYDHYVAKSEYRKKLQDGKGTYDYFCVLRDSGTLRSYCKTNGLKEKEIAKVLQNYENFESLIDTQNEQFVKSKMLSEKEYLDGILTVYA